LNDWFLIIIGLVLLTVGAEALIRGATALARRFGMSELLIGLTLVGFGTSTPELVSSLQAAFAGSPGIAVGNVVGSSIANVLLILGLAIAIAPFAVDKKGMRRDGAVVIAATVLVIAISMTGEFSRIAGLVFLASLAAYIAYAFMTERTVVAADMDAGHQGPKSLALDFVYIATGFGLLIFGARLLVGGAISIADNLGISETIVGLTIVAIGTSLPELATSVAAALRGKSGLALGNVVGSNIYNLFGILGVTAAVHPIAVPAEIVRFDNWVMLAATVAMVYFALTAKRLARLEGIVFVAAYAGYIAWMVVRS
jgi:cation:H+ antiporter